MRNAHPFQLMRLNRLLRNPHQRLECQRWVGRVAELGDRAVVEGVAGCAQEEEVGAGAGGGDLGEGGCWGEGGVG